MTARFSRAVLTGTIVIASLLMAQAQAVSQDVEGDLTIPPGLRDAAAPVDHRRDGRRLPGAPVRHGRERLDGTMPRDARTTQPVDFGVVIRGGSATPRLVSPLGGSEAVTESGSAVGAGMRFGF